MAFYRVNYARGAYCIRYDVLNMVLKETLFAGEKAFDDEFPKRRG